jgi:hypothetical protein
MRAFVLFWFLLAAPTDSVPVGTELRVLASDLLGVYATARVTAAGEMAFDAPLPAGAPVRLMLLPPQASDSQRARAMQPPQLLRGRVSDDGGDIVIEWEGGEASLRERLRDDHQLRLRLPNGG